MALCDLFLFGTDHMLFQPPVLEGKTDGIEQQQERSKANSNVRLVISVSYKDRSQGVDIHARCVFATMDCSKGDECCSHNGHYAFATFGLSAICACHLQSLLS